MQYQELHLIRQMLVALCFTLSTFLQYNLQCVRCLQREELDHGQVQTMTKNLHSSLDHPPHYKKYVHFLVSLLVSQNA